MRARLAWARREQAGIGNPHVRWSESGGLGFTAMRPSRNFGLWHPGYVSFLRDGAFDVLSSKPAQMFELTSHVKIYRSPPLVASDHRVPASTLWTFEFPSELTLPLHRAEPKPQYPMHSHRRGQVSRRHVVFLPSSATARIMTGTLHTALKVLYI